MTVHDKDLFFDRACGCLAGQFCGDAFGAQYEFMRPEQISRLMRDNGIYTMGASSVWGTLPGQITDDSEMALALARSIISSGRYDRKIAKLFYINWMNSSPFDMGCTCAAGLSGEPNPESQANGAMMRIAPLALYLSKSGCSENEDWRECDSAAASDALITHPNKICVQANILFIRSLVKLISSGIEPIKLYEYIREWSVETGADKSLISAIESAENDPPSDYIQKQGWVLTAFHNAIYQLLHAASPEEGIIDTVKRGGDTDTNAAIAGEMLGARFGYKAFPEEWLNTVNLCRPGGKRPRPLMYWVGDIKYLTEKLLDC
jgi:ADP-ribosylglycohydrolase